ncbi:MAG: transposase [Betaproteobacteria bacterium]|nr:transposase [Betaproteobacteria bacterium]
MFGEVPERRVARHMTTSIAGQLFLSGCHLWDRGLCASAAHKRRLLGELCHIVERLLNEAYSGAGVESRPGLILFVQTFGDLVIFNLHIHVLAADGVFGADDTFTLLPAIPAKLLELGFRSEVFKLLVAEGALSEQLAAAMLAWRHSGFSVHNGVRVRAHDADGRKKLAQYMLRAPFSLEKMSYDAQSGMVIYRSRLHKGLKRNFQLMPGVLWLELLCRHIPDRFEHLVRYFGWYSNRVRAKRARTDGDSPVEQEPQDRDAVAARARSSWARLIHKVYDVDPLQCPKCHGPMRVIALIEDETVIRRIQEHLGLWAPRQVAQSVRSPPVRQPDAGVPTQTQDTLTYHPVPDIA